MAKTQVKQSNTRRMIKRIKRNTQACLGVMCATFLLVAALPLPSNAIGEGAQEGPAQANTVVAEAPAATSSEDVLPVDDVISGDDAVVSDGASLNAPVSDVAPEEPVQGDFPAQSLSPTVEDEEGDPELDKGVQDGNGTLASGAAPDESNAPAVSTDDPEANDAGKLNALPSAGAPEANKDGAFANGDPEGFSWIFSAGATDDTCKITGYNGGTITSGTVHVPATNPTTGKKVVAITGSPQGNAFKNLQCQIDFSLAVNLQSIDQLAFAFSGVKGNIDLSKCVNLTNIAQFSFKQALSITGLVLPPNLTTIGAYAFQDDKALTGNLALPKSLKSLGASAFTGCQLTSLVIPDDTALTSIASEAFKNNAFSGSLVLPSQISTVGGSAFANDTKKPGIGFTNVAFRADTVAVGEKTFRNNAIANDPFVGQKFSSIGAFAFEGNNLSGTISLADDATGNPSKGIIANNPDITEVILSSKWLVIPDNAFQGLTKLVKVSIPSPNQIGRVGEYAFQGCTSLQSINFNNAALQDNAQSGIAVGQYAFQGCTNLREVFLGTGTFGSQLQAVFTVGYRAFKDCTNFTFIDIPAPSSGSTKISVKVLGEAFMNTNLGKFPTVDENGIHYDKPLGYIPLDRRTLTSIGPSAFENANISEVRLPNTLALVGARAFAGNHLTNLELPRNGNLDTPGNVGADVLANQTVNELAIWGDSLAGDNKADVELEALHALGLVHSRVDAVGLNSGSQTNIQPDNSGTWKTDHVATYDKSLVEAQDATFTYGYEVWRTGGSKALSRGTVTLTKVEKGVPFTFYYYDNPEFSGTPSETHVQWVGVSRNPVEESHGIANFGLNKPGYYTQAGAYAADTNAGWRTGSGPGGTGLPIDPATVTAQDTFSAYEYYNRWLPHSYSVEFDNNWGFMVAKDPGLGKTDPDGATVPDDALVSGATAGLAGLTYGEPVALPDNGFTMGGYELAGWATSPDLAEGDRAEGANFFSPGSSMATPDPAPAEGGTVTLYAQWKAVDYGANDPALLGFLSIPQHIALEPYGGKLYSKSSTPNAPSGDHTVVVSAESEIPGATWPSNQVYQVSVTRPDADASLLALSGDGDAGKVIQVLKADGSVYDPVVNDADNPGAVPSPLVTIDPHDGAKRTGSFMLASVDPSAAFSANIRYVGTMTFRVDIVQKGATS